MYITCILLAIALIVTLFWVKSLKKENSSLSTSCNDYLDVITKLKETLNDLTQNLEDLETKVSKSIFEVKDKIPKKKTASSYAMQLANEIAPHIKIEDGEIILKVWDEDSENIHPIVVETENPKD